MKYMRRIVTLTLALMLALMLGLLPVFAPAAVAEVNFKKNEWVVLPEDDVIYRNAALTKSWVTVPYRMMVKLVAVRDNVGAIVNGRNVGYISLDKVAHLTGGSKIVTKRATLAYQKPSTKSRSIKLAKGVELELVALAGSCAKVTKDGVTAYVNIKHCQPAD